MPAKTPTHAWMNGELIPWENAKVHVRSEGFMRGANVFEGIRAYASPDKQQLYVFRNPEHMDRLFNSSMKVLRMEIKWSADDLTQGMLQMLRANNAHEDVHIRPTVYFGRGESFGFQTGKIEVGAVITAEERPSKPSLQTGIAAAVSSWRRISDDVMPPRVKAAANYLNSRYAKMQAQVDGYDDAIILNQQGKVSEGTGACVMIVRHGEVVTPPVTDGILESVTRTTLIELFQKELGLEVVQRDIDRTELYVAEEVFFCGTGAEVQPITSVDRYPVGSGATGPVVKQMQEVYFGIARGQNSAYERWLIPVY